MDQTKTRTIIILAMPGVQLLDVSGPLDVFAEANVQAGSNFYRLHVVASASGAVVSSSGIRLMPDRAIGQAMAADNLRIKGLPLPPYTPVLELEPRLRCRECDARGKAVVSIRWGAPD